MLRDIPVEVILSDQREPTYLVPRKLCIIAQRLHIVNGGTKVGRSILASEPDLVDGLCLGYSQDGVFHDSMILL